MPPPPRTVIITPPRWPDWLSPKLLLFVALGLFAMITANTCWFTVPADSIAVILRFGGYLESRDPGLQFKLPLGIDQHILVAGGRQQKMEFGFATPGSSNPAQYSSREEQQLERSIITGDRNAASVEWVVQYRISDPKLYLFAVREPEATLRAASESVMREVVGDRVVDEVLTIGRSEIESESAKLLQDYANRYSLGIKIDKLQLKNVTPPSQVQASFNEVNQSQQERERMINEARGQYNRAVPRAGGEADKQVAAAEGEAIRRINEAEGDAGRFSAILKEYQKAPAITRQRLYLEAMAEVLPKFKRRILMDGDPAHGILPFLQLDPQTTRQQP